MPSPLRSLLCLAAPLLLAGCTPRIYADPVPDLRLPDPDGEEHSLSELCAPGGAVFVVAPATYLSLNDQRDWAAWLLLTWPEGTNLVFVEDLEESWFSGALRKHLSKLYPEDGGGTGITVLLDRDGRLRRAFNVQEGEVVVLTYTDRRRLARVIDDDDGSYFKAKEAWEPLERRAEPPRSEPAKAASTR